MLWNVEFGAMLSLRSETPIHVRVERKGNAWSVVTGRGSVRIVTFFSLLRLTLLGIEHAGPLQRVLWSGNKL